MSHRSVRWRILSVFAGETIEGAFGGDKNGYGAVEEFSILPPGCEAEVTFMHAPAVAEFQLQLQTWQPNFVYLYGGYQSIDNSLTQCKLNSVLFQTMTPTGEVQALTPSDFADLFTGLDLQAVFLDAAQSEDQAAALFTSGCPLCLYWPKDQEVNALAAADFTRALFAILRSRTASVAEAFALAQHSAQVHFTTQINGRCHTPLLPRIYHAREVTLPNHSSIPLPMVEDIDLSGGVAAAVPGWEDVRLLSPQAELRLLVCGHTSLIEANRLGFLCETLRGLLVLEVRDAVVQHIDSCQRVPPHIPTGCTALRCEVRTSSGALSNVVISGPPEVLQNRALLEHALRQTMVADALSIQIKLPPPGSPPPVARSSSSVGGGASVVDVVLATSVWAVHVLRQLCKNMSYRGLVLLGIAAVGSSPVAAFTSCDAQRYKTFLACTNDKSVMVGRYLGLQHSMTMGCPPAFSAAALAPARAAASKDASIVSQRSGSYANGTAYR